MLLLSGCALQSITEPRRVDPDNEPTPVPTAVSVASATYTVASGDITRVITLSGIIVPVTQINLSFAKAGQVAAVHVRQGDEVAEGDVLAELNVVEIERELTLALSSLDVAQSQLAAAETALANNRRRAEIAVEKLQATLDLASGQC